MHGKCWMDYFWLAPSCRHNSSKCILVKKPACVLMSSI